MSHRDNKPENRAITPAQRRWLVQMAAFEDEHLRPATNRELAAIFGCVHNAARDMRMRLRRKGLVAYQPHTDRGSRLTAAAWRIIGSWPSKMKTANGVTLRRVRFQASPRSPAPQASPTSATPPRARHNRAKKIASSR